MSAPDVSIAAKGFPHIISFSQQPCNADGDEDDDDDHSYYHFTGEENRLREAGLA